MLVMSSNRPILVTGAPRSGTTWVGRTIAAARSVRYIHEPFQVMQPRCACGNQFDHWFSYVSGEQQAKVAGHLRHVLGSPLNRFDLLNLVIRLRTAPSLKYSLQQLYRYGHSLFRSRPLLKAPIACLSADWLASTFDMDVIVTVRHPAAFVSSYKKLNWSHPFSHFAAQPALMQEQLHPFEEEIHRFIRDPQDIVDQASLLWRLIYFVLLKNQQKNDWMLVRHEDIACDPHHYFRGIFRRLGLPYTRWISRRVNAQTDSESTTGGNDPYNIKRNSRQVLGRWKHELTSDEIKRVRKRVEDVAAAIYTDCDW